MSQALERDLLIEERRRRICELLREQGRVTVEALAARFGTSQVTIRADLSTLESSGALTRTTGSREDVATRERARRSRRGNFVHRGYPGHDR